MLLVVSKQVGKIHFIMSWNVSNSYCYKSNSVLCNKINYWSVDISKFCLFLYLLLNLFQHFIFDYRCVEWYCEFSFEPIIASQCVPSLINELNEIFSMCILYIYIRIMIMIFNNNDTNYLEEESLKNAWKISNQSKFQNNYYYYCYHQYQIILNIKDSKTIQQR